MAESGPVTWVVDRDLDMLWLAGLMGLLAVGAFSLLWFLPMGSTKADPQTEDEDEIETSLEVGGADIAAGTKDSFDDAYARMAMADDGGPLAGDEVAPPAGEAGTPDRDGMVFALAEWDDTADDEAAVDEMADEDAVFDHAEAQDVIADGRDGAWDGDPDEEWDHDLDDVAVADEQMAEELDEDWFAAGAGLADFEDFDPQEDDLVVVWDDSTGLVPHVQVVRNDADPALARVILGDTILAEFRTRADAVCDQVSLVPLSTARSLGWAHP